MEKYNIELTKGNIRRICAAINSSIQDYEDYITEYICEQDEFDKEDYKNTVKMIKEYKELKEKLQQKLEERN